MFLIAEELDCVIVGDGGGRRREGEVGGGGDEECDAGGKQANLFHACLTQKTGRRQNHMTQTQTEHGRKLKATKGRHILDHHCLSRKVRATSGCGSTCGIEAVRLSLRYRNHPGYYT